MYQSVFFVRFVYIFVLSKQLGHYKNHVKVSLIAIQQQGIFPLHFESFNMKTVTITKRIGKVDKIRSMAINQTAKHFDCDPSHVRKIDSGERENEEIKKYYRELYTKLSKLLTA